MKNLSNPLNWLDSAIQCETKGIIVINPGNPTGQVLPRGNIEEVVRFAYDAGMFIIADEVRIW